MTRGCATWCVRARWAARLSVPGFHAAGPSSGSTRSGSLQEGPDLVDLPQARIWPMQPSGSVNATPFIANGGTAEPIIRWNSLSGKPRSRISMGWSLSLMVIASSTVKPCLRRPTLHCYSSRNVTIGSTRDARRAGVRQAANATANRSTATAEKVSGSRGWTPKSSVASRWLSA